MSNLARLSFSLEKPLLDRLETLVADSHYENRSEYIRDLIRGQLVEKEWERNEEALGTVTLIYDHHARQLSDKLTDVQHDYHDAILATTHVHLDHHLCAEMIMVRGRADRIRSLADQLRRQKGVLHATLSMSSTGRKLR
jgi:CopG family nickel-responsive transcriptional regulator